jgi:hypothetical protein
LIDNIHSFFFYGPALFDCTVGI